MSHEFAESDSVSAALAQAVAAAKQAWGERRISELEAEDRLAMACEKAPTPDPATSKLRAAFRVRTHSQPSCHGSSVAPWCQSIANAPPCHGVEQPASCPNYASSMSRICMVIDSCQHPLFLKSVWLLQKLEADYKAVTDKEKEEVVALGGLHVVGTERHVSGFVFNHPALLRQCTVESP